MGRELLISDLRAKGEEQVATLWRQAREEAERFRLESERDLAAQLGRRESAELEAVQAVHRRRAMAAHRRSAAITTRAEQALSDRLYALARTQLGQAGVGERAAWLAGLAAELPAAAWARVRVNPADAAAARALFPQAEIVADPAIPGGLEVSTADESVCIDNTLNTRLARAWSLLVPELLREAARDETAG